MSHRENLPAVIIKGALAGLVGTAAITVAAYQAPRLAHRLSHSKSAVPARAAGEIHIPRFERVTGSLIEKVSEDAFHRSMDAHTRRTAGQAAHWIYGSMLGILYGVGENYSRLPGVLFGAMFGGAAGLTDSAVASSMNLWPNRMVKPVPMSVAHTGMRLLFGWVTAFTYDALSRFM